MSPRPLATLNVTSSTTLDQLKAFQESIGKDDAKLRGKVNDDGSITLKAVDRDSSFLSKMFGISKDRRDAARSAINMVMRNSGAADRKPVGSLNSAINADRKHSPKSAMLRDLVAFAKADNVDQFQKVSETPVKKESHDADVMSRKFPTLEAKGLSTTRVENYIKTARDLATSAPLSDAKIKEFANEIRTDLYAQLTKDGPLGLNDQMMLGVSDIEGYVTAAIARAVPLPHDQQVSDAMDKIAKGAADQLAEQLLGTKHVNDDSFQIGNEVFNKVRNLGHGGFGTVDLYRCDATGQEIALKVPKQMDKGTPINTVEQAIFNFRAEIDMHTKVMSSAPKDDPHILSLKGAVRLPSGYFATITEACTSGEMAKIMAKLDDPKEGYKNVLTSDQILTCKLTMMLDMANGQNAVYDRGFSHRDTKFQNVFVDSKGVAKVADFGESAFSKSFSLSNEKLIDNPLFLAPENLVAREKINAFEKHSVEHQYAHLKAKVEVYNALVGPGGIFSHLGEESLDAKTFDPLPQGSGYFEQSKWKNTGQKLMSSIDSRLEALGETGKLIKMIVNDLAGKEALKFQDAIASKKAQLPTSSLIDGGAADVWSFGAAILTSFVKPDQSINQGEWTAAGDKLIEYFQATPKTAANGSPPAPLPEALAKGGLLTDAYFNQKAGDRPANGTVTGDAELDQLVNMCLRRDPDTRPSFADILQSPVFQREGVGDINTRNLIAAIGGKPAKTKEEIATLAAKML